MCPEDGSVFVSRIDMIVDPVIGMVRICRGRFAELGVIQFGIDAAGLDQLRVASPFHDHAAADDQDLIRRQNGGQAVGDQDTGPGLDQGLDGLLDLLLGYGIQGRSGFVEDQQGGILEQDPGDGNTLLLAAGQLEAPVAYHGIQTLFLGRDKVINIGLFTCLDQFLFRGVRTGVEQIVADGPVEQVGLLARPRHRGGGSD